MLLGYDIGGTHIRAAIARNVVRAEGETIHIERVATEPISIGTDEDFLGHRLISLTERLFSETGPLRIESIGVSTTGPVDRDLGILDKPTNLRPDGPVKLIDPLKEYFHLPIYWSNDAHAAAKAEYDAGAGRGAKNMMYYVVSTGIGWALIDEGRIYEGTNGNTEGGHSIIRPNGPICACGLHGCLTSLASGRAYQTRAITERMPGSLLKDGDTAKEVFLAAHAGDPTASRLVEEGMDALAQHVAGSITMLNPERVVFGGGVTRADGFFDDLSKRVQTYSQPAGNLRNVTYLGLAELGKYVGIAAPFALLKKGQYRFVFSEQVQAAEL